MSLDLALKDEQARPYFLWDCSLTLAELRQRLHSEEPDVKLYWMARVMRDARYWDVWRLLTLADVLTHWPQLRPRLGRARERWETLIEGWQQDGLIPTMP